MTEFNQWLQQWVKDQIGQQALASVASGQVDPHSTIGQSILAQHPIGSMAGAGASMTPTPPTAGYGMPQGTQTGQAPSMNPSLASLPNYPQPPVRPADLGGNAAGAGLQAFHNNLANGGGTLPSAPLPVPRPQTPDLNSLMQANAAPQAHNNSLVALLQGLGHNLGSAANGIGQGLTGLGQNIGHGLDGIFSGLFNNGAGG